MLFFILLKNFRFPFHGSSASDISYLAFPSQAIKHETSDYRKKWNKNNFLWNDFVGVENESKPDEFLYKCKFFAKLKWKALKVNAKRDSI